MITVPGDASASSKRTANLWVPASGLSMIEAYLVLGAEAYDDARLVAPGYDVHYLEQEWRSWWVESGTPELGHPARAFVAFCKSRYKRRPILDLTDEITFSLMRYFVKRHSKCVLGRAADLGGNSEAGTFEPLEWRRLGDSKLRGRKPCVSTWPIVGGRTNWLGKKTTRGPIARSSQRSHYFPLARAGVIVSIKKIAS